MARQGPARLVLAIGLLLIVMLSFAALCHAHADLAVLSVVFLFCVCVVLPVLPHRTGIVRLPLPLRPALLPIRIQLPPPYLLR